MVRKGGCADEAKDCIMSPSITNEQSLELEAATTTSLLLGLSHRSLQVVLQMQRDLRYKTRRELPHAPWQALRPCPVSSIMRPSQGFVSRIEKKVRQREKKGLERQNKLQTL